MRNKFIILIQFLLLLPLLPILGALKVKGIDASSTKWATNARGASAEFAANAEAAASDWLSKTIAGKDNFGMAISAAGIKERFARGVAKAGAAKFARKIRDVAAGRFSGGVDAGQPDYKEGAAPYYSLMAGLTLSARKPKGDPANIKRVEEVDKANYAKRLALLGGGGA